MLKAFEYYLIEDGKSENTVKSYMQSVSCFLRWFEESKDMEFRRLHQENIREYISYLKATKQSKPKTINTKLNALVKFNEFLVEHGFQPDMVVTKKDFVKVQQQYASLAKVEYKDVEMFRQLVLESGSKRNYAIVTLLSYAGLRISEALALKMNEFNLTSRELIVQDGKGEKMRVVFISDRVKSALQEWLKERQEKGIDNEHLFVSNRNKPLNRTTINKIFNELSRKVGKEITPHDLRHFFCSHAISKGLSVHEVANQAGHSNIHTTLLYTNPTKDELVEKMNKL
ncbi:tyrosine-type recombinase/integrase [Bacillus badius]|uniref:Phage integrase family protein n=1 Tax=Bacillus badius TaxID=1455 RepID=A0ABR5APH2_BACBA|nr:tyrosine-type recombinase/integrase [Bacillus badius]KIL74233.1 phage integrase family protein [Bacillus badius]KZR57463.1 transposase [Bacillus badius]MED4717287.1 tyrosine-type recombinase/integrase [Bacillus badius]